ncbi:Cof-type HAD-IIB family hydrolase [Paenibacillus doosanensis]|uniref:Cof-type HAD-IIB family hydrolase n=1 Tax=Paenibacillus doosanensis TaxID=1229154 RepID=UPI00217FF5B8|nr:HAD family hydrolase [Paenibacillus doosanensis]MCS7460247.1 Cof-type HAD-IIB family hydrolase [Paenibacillus doosanensis]
MANYKLIALDMDGTFLTEDKTISAENRKAVEAAAAAGVTVMFSTGRGIQNVLPYVEELGLKSPIVSVNGSEVWTAPGQLHSRTFVEPDLVEKMLSLALEYDTWYWAYAVSGIYNKEKWVPKIDSEQWLKFGYYYEDEASLRAIREQLISWDMLEVTNSHPCNIELNPKGVSKASGLKQVCELLGIEMSQVIAMGDSLNDVTMIREAGLGVAMGNAQDEVKELADVVTATNEEHGVAKIIEQYVLR